MELSESTLEQVIDCRVGTEMHYCPAADAVQYDFHAMQFSVLGVIFVRVFVYYINIVCSTVHKY